MKALALLVALWALPALADCPCPPEPPKPKAAKQHVQKSNSTKPTDAKSESNLHAATFKKASDASPCPKREYHGTWLLGGGPMLYKDFGHDSTKVGATAVVGYRLEHDWEFLIGPTWQPHDPIVLTLPAGCTRKVDAPGPLGAQFLVVYEF